jgi:hypothetical protein
LVERRPANLHFEPYLHLAGLRHDAALIAWGGFYFRPGRDGSLDVVDDEDLDGVGRTRTGTIGAGSTPYGPARVEVRDLGGRVVAVEETGAQNWVWVRGLSPDSHYRYRVFVSGRPWAEDELRDWSFDRDGRGALRPSGRRYDPRFHTHPAPSQYAPLAFAAMGDCGTGVRTPSTRERVQREVAASLERSVLRDAVRFVVLLGDNVYARERVGLRTLGSGDEDDDWFFPFYQPYRHVLARVPFYPVVGNHDSAEQEASDDREQMLDNFLLAARAGPGGDLEEALIDPCLVYRLPIGRDLELYALDTSTPLELQHRRMFRREESRAFIEKCLGPPRPDSPRWRIPFMHHPPWSGGPEHDADDEVIEHLVPRFREAGARIVLAGHEHAFQHLVREGMHVFISGAGGKVCSRTPEGLAAAGCEAWALHGHYLLVRVSHAQVTVQPLGPGNAASDPAPIVVLSPQGTPVTTPIVIPW